MYQYVEPIPIEVDLSGSEGYELRRKAYEFVQQNPVRGPEYGTEERQGFGILAELKIREMLDLGEKETDMSLGYDILLPTGVKVDVKCRAGVMPFQRSYRGTGSTAREAKHNLYARQVYDDRLETDIYLMTHLRTPRERRLPGTPRQRTWRLYVCGWVSKKRVKEEAPFLPRGSLTEQGQKWFPYKAQEIEFYHRHLNGLRDVRDLLHIEPSDVEADQPDPRRLHLTSVDACRMAIELVGRGILPRSSLSQVMSKLHIVEIPQPMLHPNQFFHLLRWMRAVGIEGVDESTFEKARLQMEEIPYHGLS